MSQETDCSRTNSDWQVEDSPVIRTAALHHLSFTQSHICTHKHIHKAARQALATHDDQRHCQLLHLLCEHDPHRVQECKSLVGRSRSMPLTKNPKRLRQLSAQKVTAKAKPHDGAKHPTQGGLMSEETACTRTDSDWQVEDSPVIRTAALHH